MNNSEPTPYGASEPLRFEPDSQPMNSPYPSITPSGQSTLSEVLRNYPPPPPKPTRSSRPASLIIVIAAAAIIAVIAGTLLVLQNSAPSTRTITTSAANPTQLAISQHTPVATPQPTNGTAPTSVPGASPTPGGSATPMMGTPTSTGTGQLVLDNLKNWSIAVGHTNVIFDQGNQIDGDADRVVRANNTPASITWGGQRYPRIIFFQAITYFAQSAPAVDFTLWVSSDNRNWQPAPNETINTVPSATPDWNKTIYTLSPLPDVAFVQIRWGTTTAQQFVSGTPEIGTAEYTYLP